MISDAEMAFLLVTAVVLLIVLIVIDANLFVLFVVSITMIAYIVLGVYAAKNYWKRKNEKR